MQVPKRNKEILQAYEDLFTTGQGQIVLDDMRAAYHDRSAAEVDDDLAHIPPEARIWFLEGRRDVYLSILKAVEVNNQVTTEEGNDN